VHAQVTAESLAGLRPCACIGLSWRLGCRAQLWTSGRARGMGQMQYDVLASAHLTFILCLPGSRNANASDMYGQRCGQYRLPDMLSLLACSFVPTKARSDWSLNNKSKALHEQQLLWISCLWKMFDSIIAFANGAWLGLGGICGCNCVVLPLPLSASASTLNSDLTATGWQQTYCSVLVDFSLFSFQWRVMLLTGWQPTAPVSTRFAATS
jgi:hypothetical protein